MGLGATCSDVVVPYERGRVACPVYAWVLWMVGQLPRMPPWRRGVRNTHRRHYGSRTVERFAPKRRVMAENYLPAPIGARLRGLIATPIIAKGPATLGSAWKNHGKRLYHSFTVRKD